MSYIDPTFVGSSDLAEPLDIKSSNHRLGSWASKMKPHPCINHRLLSSSLESISNPSAHPDHIKLPNSLTSSQVVNADGPQRKIHARILDAVEVYRNSLAAEFEEIISNLQMKI